MLYEIDGNRLTREEVCVLLALYIYYPHELREEQIYQVIESEGMLSMSEEYFLQYWKTLIENREMIRKARLN